MASHRHMDARWRDAWIRDIRTIARGVARWLRAMTREGRHA